MYLEVVWPHHGEHGGDAEVGEEHDHQGQHDGDGDGALRVLGLLARRCHAVEAHEAVEALGGSRHHPCHSERHEAASASLLLVLLGDTLGGDLPVLHIS